MKHKRSQSTSYATHLHENGVDIRYDVLTECDSVLEKVECHDFYVSLLILGSINYAIGNILDTAIARCGFLAKDYYLTNVEIPTDERIRDWLDGKLYDSEWNLNISLSTT